MGTTTTTTGCLVDGKSYRIVQNDRSQPANWYNAELSWDNHHGGVWASVEFNDPMNWKLEACGDAPNSFTIAGQYGCPYGEWCNAKLGWHYEQYWAHPMISVEFDAPVCWHFEQVPGEQCS